MGGGCGNKPAVWIDGGIHAREWISLATVTWMLKELVENSQEGSNSDISTEWTGISYLLTTLMVMSFPELTTGCGGRRGQITEAGCTAWVWTLIETGDFTGTQEDPATTDVRIPTTDQRHSQRSRTGM